LYGSNFGCVKILNHALEPSFAAACRFSLAGLVFLPYLLRQWRTSTALMLGGLEVGAYCAVGYWAQAKALLTSSASTVAFICSLAVIVVPLLDLLFSGKSHKSMQDAFVPAVLAALGVACLELGGQSLPGIGDLWAGLQPLFFGLGFWRVERHMARVQGPDDVLAFTGAMMLAVGILSWAWTGVDLVLPLLSAKTQLLGALSGQLGALKDFTVLAAIAWTGVVTTAFTSFVENVAMKKLTAAESTVIYSTEPLWGTAFAAAVLHESVGWNTLVGAALILTACVWSSLGPLLSTSLMTSTLSAYRDTLEEVIDNISKNLFGLLDASGNLPGEL
jgi:drug/metabolite transporter (DMT)-like permease